MRESSPAGSVPPSTAASTPMSPLPSSFDAVRPVVVIGAGWAGLSAAVHLTANGLAPLLLDAAPQPGGRARGLVIELATQRCSLDNGQHLMIGAYRETLALIDRVSQGCPPVQRSAMRLRSVDGLSIEPGEGRPPLDLLAGLMRAQGLSWRERWALVRALTTLRLSGWRQPAGRTVSQWLTAQRQPSSLIDRFWQPLCVATMNTAPGDACATTFAAVLRDTLGASAQACEFVLPHGTLDDALPTPACDWLIAHGVTPRLRTAVRALRRDAASGLWQIDTDAGVGSRAASIHAQQVVLAIPPLNAQRVLAAGGHGETVDRLAKLGDFAYEPIVTVYLAWPQSVSLSPWIMLSEQPAKHFYGQWLFDRGEQHGMRIGAVVVSARGRAWLAAGEQQIERPLTIARQVADQLELPMPLDARAIVEKRATFRCTPDRPRLRSDTLAHALPGLWLAGDHAWAEYPATLEGAVRSGRQAAEQCLATAGHCAAQAVKPG